MKRLLVILLVALFAIPATAKKAKKEKDTYVRITTSIGSCVIRLYNETPRHRDNFVKLVKQGFYDSLLFNRVVFNFMIQGGDLNESAGTPKKALIEKMNYSIPPEIHPELIHKKGALAALHHKNSDNASHSSQFYLVQGRGYTEMELHMYEKQNKMHYTEEQKNRYKTLGGTPHLDNSYTVFGEVVEGIEMIDRITYVDVDENSKPLKDIPMKIEILKKYKGKEKENS